MFVLELEELLFSEHSSRGLSFGDHVADSETDDRLAESEPEARARANSHAEQVAPLAN